MNKENLIKFLNTKSCSTEFASAIISEYINTTKYKDKCSKIVELILTQPMLLQPAIKISSDYFIKELGICSLSKDGKIILYF